MKTINFNDKIEKSYKRFEDLMTNFYIEDFLEHNYLSFNETITIYYSLKRVFKNKNNDLSYYQDFQKAFYKFYGINRFISDEFEIKYFNVLKELKEYPLSYEVDLKEFVEEKMIDKNKEGNLIIQFSFATKALNIFNDEKYPIYDSNVSKVFGVYSSDKTDIGNKLEKYIENYEIIMEVYKKILEMDKYKKYITDFREKFKYADESISDMRILDIIVWKLGEKK